MLNMFATLGVCFHFGFCEKKWFFRIYDAHYYNCMDCIFFKNLSLSKFAKEMNVVGHCPERLSIETYSGQL